MINDSHAFYMLNAIQYIGKIAVEGQDVPSFYVHKLSDPIQGTYCNITVDNWFSSVIWFYTKFQKAYNGWNPKKKQAPNSQWVFI